MPPIYIIKLPTIISLIKNVFNLKNRFKNDSPEGSSQGSNDRSDKTDLTHEAVKENLSKVDNDNTVDYKTSTEYSDDELIDFDLVGTVSKVSSLSSINDVITNANEVKRVEAGLVDSVPVSAPDNYNEFNLHLAETIDSSIDQFKALNEKARKSAEDNVSTANDIAHSGSKTSEDIFEETHS